MDHRRLECIRDVDAMVIPIIPIIVIVGAVDIPHETTITTTIAIATEEGVRTT
jgi:hypothetical protein